MYWQELDDNLDNSIWNKIYTEFRFKPSIHAKDWPSFIAPSPHVVYDISNLYGAQFNETYNDLERSVLKAFVKCTDIGESVYALDWQHSSYSFKPHTQPVGDDNWPIKLYPDEDYYFFISRDFSWGYLGHPWEQSICVFGEQLLRSFEEDKPRLFSKMIRSTRQA